MKRIYYLQRIILSVLLLLPLSGCFDSDINRKMYEADDDEMQRENHIVGATLRVMQGLVSPTREHLYQFMDAMAGGAYGGYMEGIVDMGNEVLYIQPRTGMAEIPVCRPYHRPLSPIPQDVERDG